MQNLINLKGIEETIQFIDKQHQYLDEAKKQLEDYVNYVKNGKFDLNEEGTIDQRIGKIASVLDKYDEVIERRKNVTIASEKLKKNTEGIMNKINDIMKYSGKQEEIEEINDEMIDKMMELEKKNSIRKWMSWR